MFSPIFGVMSNLLRFAIIGCGRIALRHASEISKRGELIAVCDTIKIRADEFANQFSVNPYYHIADLFSNEKELDIVSICTPNGLHAEHSIQCLHSGKHVLCEKPMATSSGDAMKMIEASKESGKKLFIVKSSRYNAAVAQLKKIIDESRLGQIYNFQLNCFWNRPPSYYSNSWKGDKLLDGGTLYTQFSHYIDALLWLLGDIHSVAGFAKNFAHRNIIDFEDSGMAAITMKNGTIGGINWTINSFQKNIEVSLSIIAEKGSIKIGGEYMNEIEYQLIDGMDLDVGVLNKKESNRASMSNHDKIYENVLKVLNQDEECGDATDDLKTVVAIETIYKSVSFTQ